MLSGIDPVRRRAWLFERCCLSVVAVAPLFFWTGWVQGGERTLIVAIMTVIATGGALASWALSRRGQMELGIDVLISVSLVVIVGGTQYAGRAGLVVFLMAVMLVLGSLHSQSWRVGVDALLVGTAALATALTLEPMDPVQMPLLVAMLVLVGLLTFFVSRVNELNTRSLEQVNVRLTELNAELDEARERAEAASEAKSLFLATMSHELRTPLNAVLGYTEMVRDTLADGEPDLEEADEDLAQVEIAARRLLTQVSRILDITRIESAASGEPEPIGIAALVEELVARHRSAAEQAGIALVVTVSDPGLAVRSHRDRIVRILSDLLENAIRFTPEGRVELGAEALPDGVRFTVRDTGIGISEHDIPRVFELFHQVDGSTTRRVDGVGLGLTLCKRLADSMGATLALRSAPGQGTTFRLDVPDRADASTEPVQASA